jgi:hypothetical protein
VQKRKNRTVVSHRAAQNLEGGTKKWNQGSHEKLRGAR